MYCSEGSPEGFSPALYTAGTTFDASSRQIYNRLVEFEHGTTNIRPGLAESWTVSDDGLEYTFKLRQEVAFQTTDWFTPSRPFNADDVVFSFERSGKRTTRTTACRAARTSTSPRRPSRSCSRRSRRSTSTR